MKKESLNEDYIIKEFIKNSKVLTDEEEKYYFKKYINEKDKLAKEILLKNNIKLVLDIYYKHYKQFYKYKDDLLQEGLIALNDAIDRFDINKNQKLSTYAKSYINGYMKRYLTQNYSNIRMSYNKTEYLLKIKKAKTNFIIKNLREPTLEELSIITNLPVNEIKNIISNIIEVVSLNNEVNNKQYEELLNINYNLEDEIIIKDLYNNIKKLINILPNIEKNILYIKYGFYDGLYHSNKETAELLFDLKITSRIISHQMIDTYLKKISQALNSNIIRTKIGLNEIDNESKTNCLRKILLKDINKL